MMKTDISKSSAGTESMFSAIAGRYDLCNHLFSFGMDMYWRRKAARLCCEGVIDAAADLCCGTGDMAFALMRTGRVKTMTAYDVSGPMIERAKRKHARKTGTGLIEWRCCRAEETGLPEAAFELVTCAFGLRNVDDIPPALKEMYRLLRPGGRACILEFFLPQHTLLRGVYRFYLGRVMPLLAGVIAGDAGPWRYLADSIAKWEKVDLAESMQAAGFEEVTVHSLTFSTVRITMAKKKS